MNTITITIGREDDNVLQVQEEFTKVSRRHGQIDVDEDGGITFTDYSSRGTTVNDVFVQNKTVTINRGDKIILGDECALNWEILNNYLPEPKPDGKKTVYKDPDDPDKPNTGGQKTKLKVSEPDRPHTDTNGHKTKLIGFDTDTGGSGEKPSSGYSKKKPYTASEISSYLRKWNWGAFFLSFVWGCFHKVFWPLYILAVNLIVTPLPWIINNSEELIIAIAIITWIVHLALAVIAVYLGLNGSELAWRKKICDGNLDLFKKKEQRWATAGFVCFGVGILAAAVIAIILL